MDNLLSDLFAWMAQRADPPQSAQRQTCAALRKRHLSAVRAGMGEEFYEKLRDAADECAYLDAEEAFLWGLRLGLALNRL